MTVRIRDAMFDIRCSLAEHERVRYSPGHQGYPIGAMQTCPLEDNQRNGVI